MPFVLRTLLKNRFVRELQPAWVPDGDVQADALKELQSESNDLSVWQIEDDLANLNRVLAALAAARDSLANIDYALIDVRLIIKLGIATRSSPGAVPDDEVSALHQDLTQLTASQVARLATAIVDSATLHRSTLSQVRSLVLQSIEAGYIDAASLSEGIARRLS